MSFIPDSTKLKKVRQQEPPENHEMSAEKQLDQFATTETTLPAFQKRGPINPQNLGTAHIINLQKTIGNKAVTRMLETRKTAEPGLVSSTSIQRMGLLEWIRAKKRGSTAAAAAAAATTQLESTPPIYSGASSTTEEMGPPDFSLAPLSLAHSALVGPPPGDPPAELAAAPQLGSIPPIYSGMTEEMGPPDFSLAPLSLAHSVLVGPPPGNRARADARARHMPPIAPLESIPPIYSGTSLSTEEMTPPPAFSIAPGALDEEHP
ncbi:MAG: hypothetical protein HXX08_24865 [Chloroflexi bacterium]|uniref:Uncharacterized protein n=1 Tax=Candidatus Chlorohelix allophototropha TaxID=3003348 RepID=A0A8T7MB35_9CHLR|nr:hypothetical protein [Chloroflexota bacterium]